MGKHLPVMLDLARDHDGSRSGRNILPVMLDLATYVGFVYLGDIFD